MPYAFVPGEGNITAALHRIARERIDDSLALCADLGVDEARRIHELRKNVKKLRGLIRLVRPVFADYAAENAALGAAGRQIGHLRDADVRAAGLAALARKARLSRAERAAITSALADGAAAPQAGAAEATLAEHRAALEALRQRLPGWRVEGEGFDALAPGLVRTLDRGRRAMKAARKDPGGEALHTWRKRVKDHWYHARLLAPIWPEMMAAHAEAVGRLGEALGDARDLALLAEAIEPLAATLPGAARLAGRARRDATALTAEADRLGRLVFAEDPGALAARWAAWWRKGRG